MRAINWRSLVSIFQRFDSLSRHRRRLRARVPFAAEVLESRLCLSAGPVISDLGLQNDTGEAGDNITEDPTFTGTITNVGTDSMVNLEIDFNGDGVADDWAYTVQSGNFVYDPSSHNWFGDVTISFRAVAMDYETTETTYGAWITKTFKYQPPPNDPPSIASLSLSNDTGEAGDNISQDPTLAVAILNDGTFDGIQIEIDYNGDGVADDWQYGLAEGTFELDPSSHISYGQVTIAIRAVEMDMHTTEYLYGQWQSITFTYQPPPNDPPSIVSLSLANDTGAAGDNVTQDPTLTGAILNDGTFDWMQVEVDYNGDGIPDDWLYVNPEGTFQFDPSQHINWGEVTIAVRPLESDVSMTQILYGEWVSITFTFEDPIMP